MSDPKIGDQIHYIIGADDCDSSVDPRSPSRLCRVGNIVLPPVNGRISAHVLCSPFDKCGGKLTPVTFYATGVTRDGAWKKLHGTWHSPEECEEKG